MIVVRRQQEAVRHADLCERGDVAQSGHARDQAMVACRQRQVVGLKKPIFAVAAFRPEPDAPPVEEQFVAFIRAPRTKLPRRGG